VYITINGQKTLVKNDAQANELLNKWEQESKLSPLEKEFKRNR